MNHRRNSILELANRCNFDSAHAHQVECLAGTLFLEFEPLHKLSREDRQLLEFASLLHDIGYSVAAKAHHRHGMNLILMEPLPDFSVEEKLILANLVRYHRKSLPNLDHAAFTALSESAKLRVGLLAPLLRIADALDRSHRGHVQELTCDISNIAILLSIGSETELPEEMVALSRKMNMFKHVYKRDIEIDFILPRLNEGEVE